MIEQISDIDKYNSRMSASMYDKIFYVDKIPQEINSFVDFGCADGEMFRHLKHFKPEAIIYGYEPDSFEFYKCLENIKKSQLSQPNYVYDNWNDIKIHTPADRKFTCLTLSSVIHEVYSYVTTDSIEQFWDDVFKTGFGYIAIRDMIPSRNIDKSSDLNDIRKVYKKADPELLSSFERVWGSIDNNKNLIHFFLKYKYGNNWKREVKENYLPITRSDILSRIPDNYEIDYQEHFVLPYLKREVRKDFDVEIKDNTHLKLILKKID